MSGLQNKFSLLLTALLLAVVFPAYTQCCSTGSPAGASMYVGVLNKNTLRFTAFYRNNYSDTYYEGTHKTDKNVALRWAGYNFSGITLGYGITNRLTIEADAGYFFNKTQQFKNIDYREKGYGLSNGGLNLKYGLYIKPIQQVEVSAALGMRFPFSTSLQVVDGVQLSRDVQPSTNAHGLTGMIFLSKGFSEISTRIFSVNRYEYNFEDKKDYRYGSNLMNSIFVSKKIIPYLFAILQVRSELRGKDQDNGDDRVNTGNFHMFVSPQISYSLLKEWNLSVLCDIPVYKDYEGKQLTPSYSFAVSITRDLNLCKRK
jgi:hypothetical protein